MGTRHTEHWTLEHKNTGHGDTGKLRDTGHGYTGHGTRDTGHRTRGHGILKIEKVHLFNHDDISLQTGHADCLTLNSA